MDWWRHGLCWAFCGEWVLIFRRDPSGRYFGGVIGVTWLRATLAATVLPVGSVTYLLWYAACVAVLRQLWRGWSGRWGVRRRQLTLPEEGVSWLREVVPHPRVAGFLEVVAMVAAVGLALSYVGAGVVTAGPRGRGVVYRQEVPDATRNLATGQWAAGVLAYLLYSRKLYALRDAPRSTTPPPSQLGFAPVRLHDHPPLPLPSVTDLAQQLPRFYG